MKSEFNHYNISNPDGVDKTKYSEEKKIYTNDDPDSFKENSFDDQSECDNSVLDDMSFENTSKTNTTQKIDISSVSSTSATSTISSVASSGLSAIAGVVASSVMTAVMVVVAFVSTLTVNLSLVMASINSFVFQVEFSGVQEEDYNMQMFAILENKNGDYREQEINFDTLFVTFDDLEPGTEYVIIIKNEEKEFVKKSYYTATKWQERGYIFAFCEGDEVFVGVEDVKLNAGEYYTITAKDNSGKVMFATDDVEQNKDFRFKLDEEKNLYFTLAIGGKVFAVTQIEFEPKPDPHKEGYDLDNGVWSWGDNNSSATISFAKFDGGDPLVISAQVRESYFEPTCEQDGYYSYLASVEYDGQIYQDTKIVVQENSAYGHNYVPRGFVWDHDEYGNVIAFGEGVCSNCEQVYTMAADMSQNGDLYTASIVYDGRTYTENRVEINLTDKQSSMTEQNHYQIKPYSFLYGSYESEQYIDFLNNKDHPYIIKGTANQVTSCFDIYNTGILSRSDYYFVFDNVSINTSSSGEAIIFNLSTTCDVTIHIDIVGEVEFNTSNMYAFFASTTRENISVTFDINYLDQDSSFVCYDDYNETTNYYGCLDLNVIFKINGVRFDPNGEEISQYDFTQGTWSWSNDYTEAYLSFPEVNGKEALVFEVFVQAMETPATCDEMGSIVYTASIYVEEADELFSDEQIVEIEPTGHIYGELIQENYQGNGLLEHYECSVCHKLFVYENVEYIEKTAQELAIGGQSVEISLTEGQLYINPNGYARQESDLSNPNEFVSSATTPYLICDQEINDCDNIINVYQTDSSIEIADVYIKLKNVTIEAGSWCSLFRIFATQTLNIHLIIEGNVSFVGGDGQQVFSSQGSSAPTVNIIIDQTTAGGTFNAEADDGLTYAQTGIINVSYV